jgi:hypothetical protein
VADIFISYASEDRDEARLLAAFLEAEGYSVWWDTSLLAGDTFRKIIMTELGRARAAIVIWTERSINSDWVQSEAGRAHADHKLIPVKAKALDYKEIPPPFDNMHIENVGERDKILGAVVAQLAKSEKSSGAFVQFGKKVRFELLSWIGLVGGVLTLATHMQSALTLARWAKVLFESWTSILTAFWGHLLFFLPAVSKSDAMVLTLMSVAGINLFHCVGKRERIAAAGRTPVGRWLGLAVWMTAIFVVFVVGNPGFEAGYFSTLAINYLGGRSAVSFAIVHAHKFVGFVGFGFPLYVIWTYLFLLCVVPVILGYFIVSRLFSLRLDVNALSHRLSRIVIGVAIIVALNYAVVWFERPA